MKRYQVKMEVYRGNVFLFTIPRYTLLTFLFGCYKPTSVMYYLFKVTLI